MPSEKECWRTIVNNALRTLKNCRQLIPYLCSLFKKEIEASQERLQFYQLKKLFL